MRLAINGFGRIGRAVLRAGWSDPSLEFVHINDLTSPDMLAYLLKRDSVYGTWSESVTVVEGGLQLGDRFIRVTAERDPSNLPWAEAQVDVVLECTGVFTKRDKAAAHLTAGAKRVIISAPGSGVDATFVYGVNHTSYDPAVHHIVSNASCTTNCLAPVAKVLHDSFGIVHGSMSTIHSYTMDQNLLDAPHPKGRFRRARAAGLNIVPTETGAAKAIGLVLPALEGKLDGMAIRVPTPVGSLIDLAVVVEREVTVEEVNAAFKEAAEGHMRGVMTLSFEPLVSTDIVGLPASSTVDGSCTDVIGGTFVKVLSWYDNEWGFSNRMLDLARHIGGAA